MTLVTMALFVMPALIIILCYAIIIHVIWSQGKVMRPANENQANKTGKAEYIFYQTPNYFEQSCLLLKTSLICLKA